MKWNLKIICVLMLVVFCLGLLPPAVFSAEPVYITGIRPVVGPTTTVWGQKVFLQPAGATYEQAIAALPGTTTITTSDGFTHTVDLSWTSRGEFGYWGWQSLGGVYEAVGTFELPAGIAQPDPPMDLKVTTLLSITGGPPVDFTHGYFNQPYNPGEHKTVTVAFGGVNRTYHYYVPSSFDGTQSLPLVVLLHGATSSGIGQMMYTEFDILAEREGFIVVAPDYGWGVNWRFVPAQDIPFISHIIDTMIESYGVDPRRVYATGISMGGNMSAQLALEIPDKIAAIAMVAARGGRLVAESPRGPITVIHIAGTEERVGGPPTMDFAPYMRQVQLKVSPVNQTSPVPTTRVWEATSEDPTRIVGTFYSGGIYGTESIMYVVEKGGHTWPGKFQYASLLSVGRTSHHFDATEVIWNHFKQHTLPMAVDIDINPGRRIARVNLRSKGVISVAVLTAAEFDATAVEVDTVRFGNARPLRFSLKDVNRDRRKDMILRFRIQETGIQAGDTIVRLTGRSSVDGAFHGDGLIKTVPSQKRK